MCFTVAILKKDTLLTIEKYYESLDNEFQSKVHLPEFPDYYFINGFTHPSLPVIKEDGVFMYDWGLIPSWTKDEKNANEIRSKTLNAKGETIFEKPSFRKCASNQRCILPVKGFFEYRDVNGIKYPYFIYSPEASDFLIGAIYDSWINPSSGETHNTFSVVNTAANTLMEKIHNLKKRMPLILDLDDSYKWIDKKLNLQEVKNLIKPYESNKMSAHTISKTANYARMNRNLPEIMNEVIYPELDESFQNTLF